MIIFGASKQLELLKQKIGSFDIRLSTSFENVKADVNNLYEWVDYLNSISASQSETINSQASSITDIKEVLDSIPKDKYEIRRIIDEYYSVQPLVQKLDELMHRVDAIESGSSVSPHIAPLKARINKILDDHPLVVDALEELKVRMDSLEKRKIPVSAAASPLKRKYTRPKLQEKVIKSIARSSKEYVKGLILSLIQKYRDISALKLREIIVEEQGTASKSSFYRMLEELEKDGSIEMVRAGKEKHYFALEQAARAT